MRSKRVGKKEPGGQVADSSHCLGGSHKCDTGSCNDESEERKSTNAISLLFRVYFQAMTMVSPKRHLIDYVSIKDFFFAIFVDKILACLIQ